MEQWKFLEDEIIDPLDNLEVEESDEEIVEKPQKNQPDTSTEEDEESFNPFKTLASELGFEYEGDDAEDFKVTLKEQIKNEFLEELGIEDPKLSGLIKYISEGGSLDEYITNLSQLSDLNKYSNEQIYAAYLRSTTNFSEQKISKTIRQAIDSDELKEEANAARDYFRSAAEKSEEELKQNQEALYKARQEQYKQEMLTKRNILASKNILGQIIEKPKEFEKYYFDRAYTYKNDNKVYKITAYEKDLLDINKDPKKRLEYEMLIAYMHQKGFKLTPQEQREVREKSVSDLKDKLRGHYSKKSSTTIIDEY